MILIPDFKHNQRKRATNFIFCFHKFLTKLHKFLSKLNHENQFQQKLVKKT